MKTAVMTSDNTHITVIRPQRIIKCRIMVARELQHINNAGSKLKIHLNKWTTVKR